LYIATGGILFWGTDVALNFVPHYSSTPVWIITKTIVLPLIVLGAYFGLVYKSRKLLVSAPILMLVGVWLFGPIYVLIFNQFSSEKAMSLNELASPGTWHPMSTFIISTYSGALAALLLVTVVLLGTAIIAAAIGIAKQKKS
jgi:ABC-type cobalt transport system substrate-binding protein